MLSVRLAALATQAGMDAIQGDVKAQRFDRAIERLQRARRLGLWQPLLTWHIDEQIGVIQYAAQVAYLRFAWLTTPGGIV